MFKLIQGGMASRLQYIPIACTTRVQVFLSLTDLSIS